jgi:MFS transporter, PPP family, 3-phenylpropionic acid transporter
MAEGAFSRSNIAFLALTYFFYFGQLGVLVPYIGVFLDGRGFSSTDIGELMALITLARIIGPNLWAALADKSGKGLRVLQLGTLLTFMTFCLVFFDQGFWGLTISLALMMMFWTAVLPQIEVLTLACVQGRNLSYGSVRLWGSVGYIVLTIFTGAMIDVFASESPIFVSAAVLFSLFAVSMLLREPSVSTDTDSSYGSIWALLRKPVFLAFIFSALLLQFSFGPYYGFFALYARDLGYSGQATGWLIAIGVMVEVLIFMYAGALLKRFSTKWLLINSLFLTAVRWVLLATVADNGFCLIVSQTLHAFSFGLSHAASIQFIHFYFGKKYQSQGQAIYISLAFGIGGALGNIFAGHYWLQGQGASYVFYIATLVAFCAALCLVPIASKLMQTERAS